MKSIIGILICVFSLNVYSANSDDFPEQIAKQFELSKLQSKHLKNDEFKAQVSTIFSMLAFTQELAIHQMGNATENKVYLHQDGHKEAVFDAEGNAVTDCLNKASYNYYHPYQQPLSHFTDDILPWLIYGNCINDPSTKEQRIEAYIIDLQSGLEQAINNDQGFFLPENFKFKAYRQSVAISFYLKALETSGFDFETFVTANIRDKQQQELFFKAIELGINKLLKNE